MFSELRLMKLPGPGNLWKLTRPLTWETYEVPAGFLSDGNSSPLKHPASEAAGWLHDYLYRKGAEWYLGYAVTPDQRATVDRVFYRALLSDGVPRWLAYIQWLTVRAIGGRYWQRLPVSIAKEDW